MHANVLALCVRAGFRSIRQLADQYTKKVDAGQNVQLTTSPAITPNRCHTQGFIIVCVLRFLKYSKISSFVILDNLSLNLSRC